MIGKLQSEGFGKADFRDLQCEEVCSLSYVLGLLELSLFWVDVFLLFLVFFELVVSRCLWLVETRKRVRRA